MTVLTAPAPTPARVFALPAQVNVGKGGAWLLPFLCSQYGLQPQEAMIVGDRLDTDIALGRQGGLRAVLPLTGGMDVPRRLLRCCMHACMLRVTNSAASWSLQSALLMLC